MLHRGGQILDLIPSLVLFPAHETSLMGKELEKRNTRPWPRSTMVSHH